MTATARKKSIANVPGKQSGAAKRNPPLIESSKRRLPGASARRANQTPVSPRWADDLLQAITARLGSVPANRRQLTQEDADKAADAMVNTLVGVIAESTPEEDLGPFYSTTGLSRRLGVSRQALDGRIARHTLLALPGDDGSRLYPTFQFVEAGGRLDVLPGLPEVMKALVEVDDEPISIAAWVTAETGGLDRGATAIEHLRNGGAIEQVLALVEADAERLAH